ncbi:hypothetical protein [Pedobacter africanus]|uniref:Uncharacterized protein n=1 Tax=Pedobacter africanus TaxID=151894 RepID=A0A1W1ZC21_9SPHI|nr:hypothetical protein [Pedobacter africanus]SMC45832.1 hypothetical protein SAMN04488524_0573 [Pedobacter africanus]
MITPEEKDILLISLINSEQPVTIDRDFLKDKTTNAEIIINQFVSHGLVSVRQKFGNGMRIIQVEANAHDLLNRGGYKFKEEIFINNLTKLDLEIKKLEKDLPADKFDIITKAIGALASGVGIYTGLTT